MVGQSLVLLQNWGTFFRIYLAVLHRSNIMCSYLWNVFISLDTEAGVTLVGDWSKVDLVALYFIPSHYNIFLQQRHLYAHAAFRSYESEETSVENCICWNINDSLIGGGQIGSIKGMSSGSTTLYLSHAPARFTSFADFSFSFFSPLWSYSVLNVHPIFMHLITFWS